MVLSFEEWYNASAVPQVSGCVWGDGTKETYTASYRSGAGVNLTQMKFCRSWRMPLSWGFLDRERWLCQLAFTSIYALSPLTGTADGCPMFWVVRLRSDLLPWGMDPCDQANQVSGLNLKSSTDIKRQRNQDCVYACVCVCVLRTHKISLLSKFYVYNEVLLSIITLLYLRSPVLIHLA